MNRAFRPAAQVKHICDDLRSEGYWFESYYRHGPHHPLASANRIASIRSLIAGLEKALTEVELAEKTQEAASA